MTEITTLENHPEPTVTIEEVNRVLEVGRLLLSVLLQQELEELQGLLYGEGLLDDQFSSENEKGNMSVT